jgi:hypothetical protein
MLDPSLFRRVRQPCFEGLPQPWDANYTHLSELGNHFLSLIFNDLDDCLNPKALR